MNFSADVSLLVYQIEVYDQVWYARPGGIEKRNVGGKQRPGEVDGVLGVDGIKHSTKTVTLVKEFIAKLETVSDGGAECFPF